MKTSTKYYLASLGLAVFGVVSTTVGLLVLYNALTEIQK